MKDAKARPKSGLLSIGQMAALNHISADTLRFYDQAGLFSPSYRDPDSDYRYYQLQQCAQLDMLQYLKGLGLSLAEIKAQQREPDLPLIMRSLQRRYDQIEAEIRELRGRQRSIQRNLESYRRYVAAPADGTLVLEFIGERSLYSIDTGTNFYAYDIGTYERLLRKFKNDLRSKNLPLHSFCNVGTIWRLEALSRRDFHSTELFIFAEEEDGFALELCTVPANLYFCIYCDRFEKEIEYAGRLLDECERRGFTIIGDYLCEVVSDLPMLGKSAREMFIRLQVPVLCRRD